MKNIQFLTDQLEWYQRRRRIFASQWTSYPPCQPYPVKQGDRQEMPPVGYNLFIKTEKFGVIQSHWDWEAWCHSVILRMKLCVTYSHGDWEAGCHSVTLKLRSWVSLSHIALCHSGSQRMLHQSDLPPWEETNERWQKEILQRKCCHHTFLLWFDVTWLDIYKALLEIRIEERERQERLTVSFPI